MNDQQIQKQFEKIGASVRITRNTSIWGQTRPGINVITQGKNEYFTLNIPNETDKIEVVNIDPKDRHLLLLIKEEGRNQHDILKNKVLCGHDEVHWFASPVASSTKDVRDAKISLKPDTVKNLESKKRVRTKNRGKRKNNASIRQGEWFFIPEPNFEMKNQIVHRNEPLQRARGSKPHMVEEMIRPKGGTVMTHGLYAPNGINVDKYNKLSPEIRAKRGWRTMSQQNFVYVRGKVRHSDHKTINLRGWHKVILNTEGDFASSRLVTFLD